MPVSAEMKTFLASSVLLVTTLEITEILPDGTDGEIVRVTDHTRNLTVDSEVYTSAIFDESQIQQMPNLEPDNLQVTSLLSVSITAPSLRNRKWYAARVIYARYNPLDVTMGPAIRRKAFIGQVTIQRHTARAEFRTLSQLLEQPVGQVTTVFSPTELGDARCKIDLNGVTEQGYEITMLGEVDAVTDRQQFHVKFDAPIKTGETVAPDDFYEQGNLYWTLGDNAPARVKILGNTSNDLTLWQPAGYEIQVGDEMTLIAGCLKTREACRDKFDNMVNFRGFSDLPGPDRIFKIPEFVT